MKISVHVVGGDLHVYRHTKSWVISTDNTLKIKTREGSLVYYSLFNIVGWQVEE